MASHKHDDDWDDAIATHDEAAGALSKDYEHAQRDDDVALDFAAVAMGAAATAVVETKGLSPAAWSGLAGTVGAFEAVKIVIDNHHDDYVEKWEGLDDNLGQHLSEIPDVKVKEDQGATTYTNPDGRSVTILKQVDDDGPREDGSRVGHEPRAGGSDDSGSEDFDPSRDPSREQADDPGFDPSQQGPDPETGRSDDPGFDPSQQGPDPETGRSDDPGFDPSQQGPDPETGQSEDPSYHPSQDQQIERDTATYDPSTDQNSAYDPGSGPTEQPAHDFSQQGFEPQEPAYDPSQQGPDPFGATPDDSTSQDVSPEPSVTESSQSEGANPDTQPETYSDATPDTGESDSHHLTSDEQASQSLTDHGSYASSS